MADPSPPGQPASPPPVPSAAVGVVCLNAARQICLIRRGQPPLEGSWSLPGGRIEWGEPVRDAALRELEEETGLVASGLALLDVVDGLFRSRSSGAVTRHYVLVDFVAFAEGEPRAATDAAEARWFHHAELDSLGLWDETVRIIDLALEHAAAPRGQSRLREISCRCRPPTPGQSG